MYTTEHFKSRSRVSCGRNTFTSTLTPRHERIHAEYIDRFDHSKCFSPTIVKQQTRMLLFCKTCLGYVHGPGQHPASLPAGFKSWSEAGIATFGFDAHGHGQSEPLDDGSRALVRALRVAQQQRVGLHVQRAPRARPHASAFTPCISCNPQEY